MGASFSGPKGDPGERGPAGTNATPNYTMLTSALAIDPLLLSGLNKYIADNKTLFKGDKGDPGNVSWSALSDTQKTEVIASLFTNYGGQLKTDISTNNDFKNALFALMRADASFKGPKGDKGDKGDTGLQGPTGGTGPTGLKGETGAAGAAGIVTAKTQVLWCADGTACEAPKPVHFGGRWNATADIVDGFNITREGVSKMKVNDNIFTIPGQQLIGNDIKFRDPTDVNKDNKWIMHVPHRADNQGLYFAPTDPNNNDGHDWANAIEFRRDGVISSKHGHGYKDTDWLGRWDVFRNGNGSLCLDATGTNNGAKVILHPCHGHDNQKWRINGKNIVNKQSGRCLDIQGGDINGVGIWDCDPNNPNEQFEYGGGDGRIIATDAKFNRFVITPKLISGAYGANTQEPIVNAVAGDVVLRGGNQHPAQRYGRM